MQEIKIFKHERFGEIRTTTAENGEVLFVGKDVAKVLGYINVQKAIRDHVDDEDKGVNEMVTPGGTQRTIFINESGLYSLVLSSKLPSAKAFKRWVTSEVLPQIRQTGGYIPTKDAEGRRLSTEEILRLAEQIVGRTLRMLNAPSENCMTATEVAQSWGMDVKSFNQLICRMGIQYRKGGSWHLTPELEGRGLAEDRHFLYYSLQGKQKSRTYMVWTTEGVNYLNRRFLNSDCQSPKVIQLNLFVK